MSRFHLPDLSIAWISLLVVAGCGAPASDASRAIESEETQPVAAAVPETPIAEQAAAADDFWQGLKRHEIQLDQKLLVVKGSRGVIGCPYLNVAAFEKFGETFAIVPAVDIDGMLESKVTAVTPKAKALGIEVGMSGRDALNKIR